MPPAPRLAGLGGDGGDGCGLAAIDGQSIACPVGLPDGSVKQNIPAPPFPGPTWITQVVAVLALAYTAAGEESMHCAVGREFAEMVGGGGGGGGARPAAATDAIHITKRQSPAMQDLLLSGWCRSYGKISRAASTVALLPAPPRAPTQRACASACASISPDPLNPNYPLVVGVPQMRNSMRNPSV